jgi:branched-chain amino acid transport system permease protein
MAQAHLTLAGRRPLGGVTAEQATKAAEVAGPLLLVVVAQIVLFPVPVAVWFEGAVLGLLGALMAVGLALVYRSNKVVNFAQGDLGSAPAVLAYGLVGISGVNYFAGFATGLVATVVVTVVVEVLVIRRFARFPRLLLTVATIGVAQALIVVSLVIPRIWGQTPIGTVAVHFPWHFSFTVSPVTFNSDDVVAVLVSALALGAVALWSRFTDVGIASRAAGDRRDRAATLGIPVNRLQTLTWVVAGLLSFLSVFLKATVVGLPLGPTFSLTALVSALAALGLGGFANLPLVAASAVVIGTLEEGIAWDQPSSPTLVLAVVAAVVLVGLMFRQLTRRNSAREAGSQWLLASGVRDVPAGLWRFVEVRLAASGGVLVPLSFVATLPLWLGPGSLFEVSTLLVLAIVGCSIVVLTGWAGQVSLGQMGFAAVGAAVAALCTIDWHLDLSLALLISGSAAALVAFLVGIPTLRLDGTFVAVTTLAFGLATSGYLLDRTEFSWIPTGSLLAPRIFGVGVASQTGVLITCLTVVVLVVVAMRGMRRSRFGRVLRAMSTNTKGVAAYGANADAAKLAAFAVSGFIAGLAGCLLVVVNQQYLEAPFTETISIAVFTATAVGGLGSVLGAFMGAALIEGSTVFLPPSWQLFPSALGVVIVLLLFPGGISNVAYLARDKFVQGVLRRHGADALVEAEQAR